MKVRRTVADVVGRRGTGISLWRSNLAVSDSAEMVQAGVLEARIGRGDGLARDPRDPHGRAEHLREFRSRHAHVSRDRRPARACRQRIRVDLDERGVQGRRSQTAGRWRSTRPSLSWSSTAFGRVGVAAKRDTHPSTSTWRNPVVVRIGQHLKTSRYDCRSHAPLVDVSVALYGAGFGQPPLGGCRSTNFPVPVARTAGPGQRPLVTALRELPSGVADRAAERNEAVLQNRSSAAAGSRPQRRACSGRLSGVTRCRRP